MSCPRSPYIIYALHPSTAPRLTRRYIVFTPGDVEDLRDAARSVHLIRFAAQGRHREGDVLGSTGHPLVATEMS